MEVTYSHPGEIVRAWREERGISVPRLAALVKTSRQNIENLEGLTTRNPQFLPALARVMGYASSDDLRALLPPPDVANGELFEVARSVIHPSSTLAPQAWEKVMNKNVLPVWDAPRWVVVPDDALAPSISKGDAVELIPIESLGELENGDVVLVEDEAGDRWLRAYSFEGRGRHWAKPMRAPEVFAAFELGESHGPRVIARMDNHSRKRRGV